MKKGIAGTARFSRHGLLGNEILEAEDFPETLRRFGADKVTACQTLRAEFGDPDLTGPVPGVKAEGLFATGCSAAVAP
ncbi:hypothetical protein ACWKT3_22555 [Streptomyces violaceus]